MREKADREERRMRRRVKGGGGRSNQSKPTSLEL